MMFRICLLSLFIATTFGLQDNLTVVPVSLPSSTTFAPNSTTHASSTQTQTTDIASFTMFPLRSTSATTVPHSTVKPTSTHGPPTPQQMCYSFNYTKSNNPCVKLCVTKQIFLLSNFTKNNKSYNSSVVIPGPSEVTISGMCPASINSNFDRSALNLKWAGKGDNKYELNITFLLNQKENGDGIRSLDKWYLESVTYLYQNMSVITYTRNITKHRAKTITSDIRRASTCDKPLVIILNPEPNKYENGTMTWLNISTYTLQPFALNLTHFDFKFVDSCEPSGIPLFVPIIVAGILAGFVLILLILYAIGRFRMKRKGEYERLT
ncbi:hypothetical protein LOD99_16021 [Oopsacas minuta]|uniref:Uncharacterized protein n=1 Tax=Oopsacas minuta TaxID=111878 RepID=A0AAV7K609_9METZ|nr:hypothetical protein LOD99_16021 [Oopsacas minuta]